jgi:hypothetical protein
MADFTFPTLPAPSSMPHKVQSYSDSAAMSTITPLVRARGLSLHLCRSSGTHVAAAQLTAPMSPLCPASPMTARSSARFLRFVQQPLTAQSTVTHAGPVGSAAEAPSTSKPVLKIGEVRWQPEFLQAICWCSGSHDSARPSCTAHSRPSRCSGRLGNACRRGRMGC